MTTGMTGLMPEPAAPDAFASLALSLQHKLQHLQQHLDGSWAPLFEARWPFLGELAAHPACARLQADLFLAQGGGVPHASDLAAPQVQLALLARPRVIRSLAMLALAGRPGVLRCAVERETRRALCEWLDTAYEPLVAHSARGRPVPHEVLDWTEVHWACVGYHDWVALLRRHDSLWRRIVRVSLPRGLLGMRRRRRIAPADLKVRQALQGLVDAGVPWPC